MDKKYLSKLTIYRTQTAIGCFKRIFEDKLSSALNLKRVSAPIFVEENSGINDDLSGVEVPVEFSAGGKDLQIVHSLAKWKRLALHKYGFHLGEGIYTDMNAIRKDETADRTHSYYVDQWDWEKIICENDRTIDYLKSCVVEIVRCISEADLELKAEFKELTYKFENKVTFITAKELYDLYPTLASAERERLFVKEHGTTFIIGIGNKLPDGNPHSLRSPDYDAWLVNGDLGAYDPIADNALELSSMGIRVDQKSLRLPLKATNLQERENLSFHKKLLNGELPLTIGGGIGQSRLCMLLLEKAHIGEVQVSVWDEKTIEQCKKDGIVLL
jgi:aspartate--ammonia ligase